jgi:iron complex transport system ATP-binding protein
MAAVDLWIAGGPSILQGITWSVLPGEHWALLGPNGSGKTTLLSLAGAQRHPSRGTVTVLGETLGQTSLWDLRERIGVVDANQKILDWLSVEDVVLTGQTGTVWLQPGRTSPPDRQRAIDLLDMLGCCHLVRRTITTCSQGERQRVRIARSLMADPALLLLDEPANGLDLPAREALLMAMATLARTHPDLATIFVSHHLEELPASTTHAMLLREGAIVASGPADAIITSDHVSNAFGFPITVDRTDGRWHARGFGSWNSRTPAAGRT